MMEVHFQCQDWTGDDHPLHCYDLLLRYRAHYFASTYERTCKHIGWVADRQGRALDARLLTHWLVVPLANMESSSSKVTGNGYHMETIARHYQ